MKENQAIGCDECGREVPKLKRRHKGHGYCATCYARVFKRRMCPRCGELARLPHDVPDAVCRKCEVDKPCTRCGKASTSYKIGKITPYGPVCNACAPHFREPEPCESCGKSSKRLTRVKRLGHDHRLCPSCATEDHGTCTACRRHRFLVTAPNGEKMCKACRDQGEITCPSCGNQMPAGRGDACESCYWSKTCRKRIAIGQAAFTSRELSIEFGEFGEWLISATGPHKAALKINRFLSFFLEIDQKWQRIPSYPQLLNYFDAEGLRRVRLPMRWLHEEKGIESDNQAKRINSEKRRIHECLSSIPPASLLGGALQAYWRQLEARIESGRTSYTSARFAVSAAATLLLKTDQAGQRLPDQTDVDRYLNAAPGQAATLTGFTNFMNRQYGTTLNPVIDTRRARKRRKEKLARSIMQMTKSVEKDDAWMSHWVVLTMEYFHDRKISIKTIGKRNMEASVDGVWITLDGERYWLPTT